MSRIKDALPRFVKEVSYFKRRLDGLLGCRPTASESLKLHKLRQSLLFVADDLNVLTVAGAAADEGA